MIPLRGLRGTIAVLGVALAAAVAVCLLPENPYQRWRLLDGTLHGRARWIYERIHYDPTPVDVAFVGHSRIGAGVNAPRLEAALAAQGLPAHVVNFSLPEGGRNTGDVIAEELLSAKRPKLLVIGIIEKPSRFGHPAFKYLAPARLLVDPGHLGNVNYFKDLLYLPYRKMYLGFLDLAPASMGLAAKFDPAHYPGASVDTTANGVRADGSIIPRENPAPLETLERGVYGFEHGYTPPILGPKYADIEFGDERHYVRRIIAAARAKGVPVAFLFLPYYSGPTTVEGEDFYERQGPVWNAGFVADKPELYVDYGHLTVGGAKQLTDWLTPLVAARLRQDGEPDASKPAAAPRGDRPADGG